MKAAHLTLPSGGEALEPGAEGYEDARRVWNAAVDRKPALIARCAAADDVVACIEFAREQDLLISIRGGGHSVAGNSVSDGGMTIDLSRMKAIDVDRSKRSVRAEGGVLIQDLDRATQACGLATTMGNVSTTGIGGLTLGGGLGFLMRKHGLACDNLLSVDVVTADGRRLTASTEQNPDLFWGLRGGGGNFGVATAFEYRLHPVGPVLAGPIAHPFTAARDLLRFYREFAFTAPDELTCYALLGSTPDGTPMAAMLPAWSGAIDEGEKQLRPIRAFGAPLADEVAPMPYTSLQSMEDTTYRAGLYDYWASHFLEDLSDELIDLLIAYAAKRPVSTCHVALEVFGGAVSRVPEGETAFPNRRARFDCLIIGMCDEPAEYPGCVRWARELSQVVRPLSTGSAYVNYLGSEADEGGGRVRAVYGSGIYERLETLKAKYDPTNFFRMNQNVKPVRTALSQERR
jgi:FAD/FMN-containing dehydrogenase